MTTPRPNAEIAAIYFADTTLKCWARYTFSFDSWWIIDHPAFDDPNLEYYVGHEPPPPPKRYIGLAVNGREWVLPEPLKAAPKHDQLVFYISDDGTVRSCRWNNWAVLPTLYKEQRLHATEDDAQAWADFDKWCRGGGA